MKPLKAALVLMLLSTLIFSSCRKRTLWPVNGKGSSIDQTRTITNFERIHLSIDAELEYIQDSVYSVVINAQQNILDIIETKTNGSTLIIDFDKTPYDYNKVKIYIHAPKMYELNVSGSGNIKAPQTLTTSALDLTISGSGYININNLVTDQLTAKISGSGDVNLSAGQAKNQSLTVSGSGQMNAGGLQALKNTSKISGSGNITVWVIETLDVNISGSGSIKYKGNPTINSQISGSGKLIHIN